MKISIILPAHNAAKTLNSAIDSIISQTFEDYELIVIDDGSTDDTWNILTKYGDVDMRIRPYRHEINMGLIRTLNHAISLANGEYLVRMDADDIMENNRLAIQVAFMDENPKCVASGGQMRLFGHREGKARFMPLSHNQIYRASLMMCPIYHPTAILRTSFIKANDIKYNEDYVHAEDYKLWSDILKINGSILANIPNYVLRYRTSSTQISTVHNEKQIETSIRIKRENINRYLGVFGLQKLGEKIYIEDVRRMSQYIKEHCCLSNDHKKNLILILCMLYMSLESRYDRVSQFLKSGDYALFSCKSNIKMGVVIILSSLLFPNRWRGYQI